MLIIDRISELFSEKGKSAYELCRVLDINQSTMSTWRTSHRHPPADKMKTIADFFGVSLDYLMTGEEAAAMRYTTSDEDELLELFRALPQKKQYEFIGELKGFLRAYSEALRVEDKEKRSLA